MMSYLPTHREPLYTPVLFWLPLLSQLSATFSVWNTALSMTQIFFECWMNEWMKYPSLLFCLANSSITASMPYTLTCNSYVTCSQLSNVQFCPLQCKFWLFLSYSSFFFQQLARFMAHSKLPVNCGWIKEFFFNIYSQVPYIEITKPLLSRQGDLSGHLIYKYGSKDVFPFWLLPACVSQISQVCFSLSNILSLGLFCLIHLLC